MPAFCKIFTDQNVFDNFCANLSLQCKDYWELFSVCDTSEWDAGTEEDMEVDMEVDGQMLGDV